MISRFHFLTQDLTQFTHQELAEIACKSGIQWLQLRVKNQNFDTYLQIAKDVKNICKYFNTTLIINDDVALCKAVNADGVHLGKNDMPIAKAREILGNKVIIGATANTLEDCIQHQNNGANYIGLGPYKFTSTKENLSSILGLQSYKQIVNASKGIIKIPIIAIGGIKVEDVQPILQTGIYGIAVSSAINLSAEKEKTIADFLNQF
jgi:thiamine-phosphate pyrophosphorylase